MQLSAWENIIMAKSNEKSSGIQNWADIEFVNITLVEEDKTAFELFVKAPPEPITDLIGQAMVNKYKLSIGWDDTNQCYIASMTGKKDAKFNAGRSMSARSDDWYESMCLLMFKHYKLANGKTWEGEKQRNNWG